MEKYWMLIYLSLFLYIVTNLRELFYVINLKMTNSELLYTGGKIFSNSNKFVYFCNLSINYNIENKGHILDNLNLKCGTIFNLVVLIMY